MMTVLSFITPAWAEQASPQTDGMLSMLILMGVFFVAFYFLILRPQLKQAKKHKQLIQSLEVGNVIVTNGGIVGKVAEIGENFLVIEVAPNTKIKIDRQAITRVLPKDAIEML